MKYYSVITLLLLALSVSAQTPNLATDTITWVSNANENLHTGDVFNTTTLFKTFSGTHAQMIIGNQVTELTIDGADGDWTDPSSMGMVTYTVDYYGAKGVLTIERIPFKGLIFTLDLSGGGDTGIKQSYSIASYNAN